MSSDRPPEAAYEVSLNQTAILEILKQLRYAKDSCASADFGKALGAIDWAWAILPVSVRKKVGDRPSNWYWTEIAEYVKAHPRTAWIKAHPERLSTDQLVDRDIREAATAEADAQLWAHVVDVTVKFITALDEAGLYVEKGTTTRIPTGELRISKQPPKSPVPSALPRESTSA